MRYDNYTSWLALKVIFGVSCPLAALRVNPPINYNPSRKPAHGYADHGLNKLCSHRVAARQQSVRVAAEWPRGGC